MSQSASQTGLLGRGPGALPIINRKSGAVIFETSHRQLMFPVPVLMSHAGIVAKNDGLAGLLRRQHGERIALAFEQVAGTVPGGLPPSAYRYRAWRPNGADSPHVMPGHRAEPRGWSAP